MNRGIPGDGMASAGAMLAGGIVRELRQRREVRRAEARGRATIPTRAPVTAIAATLRPLHAGPRGLREGDMRGQADEGPTGAERRGSPLPAGSGARRCAVHAMRLALPPRAPGRTDEGTAGC
jgi:hypothetical protein